MPNYVASMFYAAMYGSLQELTVGLYEGFVQMNKASRYQYRAAQLLRGGREY
jgi:hypothetical protein